MVQQLPMVIVEIVYAYAGKFGTLGAMSYLFALRTGSYGAFRAEGYQFALTKASVTLKVLPLNFGLFRAQMLHEFFRFLITLVLGVQVYRTSAAIKSASRNQIFAIFGGLCSPNALNLQTD